MRVAVIQFPGSNCDQDALFALRDDVGVEADYVWHDQSSLAGYDGVCIPGGFTYGDYLRCGAMAARATVMSEVRRFAKEGKPVIGICNGFQILCEAGLLPGALLKNESQKFSCCNVVLRAENRSSIWTRGVTRDLVIPIAHGEGCFVCDPQCLAELEARNLIAFRMVGENPNGSLNNIAGILNEGGNVLGMMPHPERATKAILGLTDGIQILKGFCLVAA